MASDQRAMTEVSATNRTGAPPAHRREASSSARSTRAATSAACSAGRVHEQLVVQAEHHLRPEVARRRPHRRGPGLEQLGRRPLDDRVAREPAARGIQGGVGADRARREEPAGRDEPPAVRAQRLAAAPRGGRPLEQVHRHRVGALEPLERLAGRSAALAVHRGEHRDLGHRPLDAQPLRHRCVEVVGAGGRRERRRRPTPPRAPAARSARGRPARTRGPRARPRPGAARSAGCAARSRPSSARRRRRRPSTAPAAGRRGRRARRATGSRRSWRSARRAASRAARRPPGAPCGTARAPTCGCSARRPRRRSAARAPGPGCAGRSTRGPARAAAPGRRGRAGRPASSASVAGRGPTAAASSCSVRARSIGSPSRRSSRHSTAAADSDSTVPTRRTDVAAAASCWRCAVSSAACAQACRWAGSRSHSSWSPRRWPAASTSGVGVGGLGRRRRTRTGHRSGRPAPPRPGCRAPPPSTGRRSRSSPPWRRRWASATSQARATGTPASTRGAAPASADHHTQRGDAVGLEPRGRPRRPRRAVRCGTAPSWSSAASGSPRPGGVTASTATSPGIMPSSVGGWSVTAGRGGGRNGPVDVAG